MVIIGLLLALVGGAYLYYYTQYDHRKAIRSAQPDFSLKASEIFDLYDKDEDAANEKLLGKTVLIQGEVSSISADAGDASISLVSGGLLGDIVCELNKDLAGDLTKIQVGDQLQIKGECSGKLIDIIFVNCIIQE